MNIAQSLNHVLEARPFDHLGVFEVADGWFVRVFIPGAQSIELVELKSGHALCSMTQTDELGVFEATITQKKRPVYAMNVTTEGDQWQCIDAYQFRERAETDFPCDSETLYKTMGAQLCVASTNADDVKGVRFAVYAPNARSVSVIGDFNNWDSRRHPMQSHADGIWRLFVPSVISGDAYKFELKDSNENTLPHKSDPYNFYCAQYPEFNSIVYDQKQYQWGDEKWQKRKSVKPTEAPMAMYELHAGSWKHKDGRPLNYRELADELIPYLVEMNFTHVEFVPVSEHPFDGSWGYQPLGLFAPTSRFGSPDDFKYLVDQCHQNNISVIIDWVPAHFPSDAHGLAQFDGTALYEYEDPQRGWHPDWNSYIYDFGRYTVCDFLVSSALVWLDYFHIDGIRVDAVASLLYLDYSREEGEWIPNVDGGNHNYEAIEFVKRFNQAVYGRYPNAVTIAEESTAYDGVTRPVYAGGLGFGFKWNMGWMHDSLEYISRDPIYRPYHHNEMTFSMVYAYNENFILPLSHDEVVHGKGSILNKMPGDEWQQTANLRAYYSFMYGHPGKKLNFMGNEIGQGLEWNYKGQLDWYLLEYPRHQGIQNLFKDLNRLHRDEPALHEQDSVPEGFTWLNHDDAERSAFSFARFSKQGEVIVVVSNMTPTPHAQYRVGVPKAGQYKVLLNSDSEHYGGSNVNVGEQVDSESLSADGQAQSILIDLPPLGTLYLKLAH